MKKIIMALLAFGLILQTSSAFAGWKDDETKTANLKTAAQASIEDFKTADPALKKFFDIAYGYVIFPNVGKGAVGVGGAYGEGIVYEKGAIVGHASLSQISVGFQWGGQAYSEIIYFKDKAALDNFKQGNFKLGAAVSAVVATVGASADADFKEGLAIFTHVKGGLMYEASVAGQKFKYWAY
jgi:lipid-binding SYLF domain-containing protein